MLLVFVAASIAAEAAMSAVTVPVGEVMSKVYVSPSTATKLPLVPLPIDRSVRSKPVTVSSH